MLVLWFVSPTTISVFFRQARGVLIVYVILV